MAAKYIMKSFVTTDAVDCTSGSGQDCNIAMLVNSQELSTFLSRADNFKEINIYLSDVCIASLSLFREGCCFDTGCL